jgi:drug/metabolite transporter (DMT)-like permease
MPLVGALMAVVFLGEEVQIYHLGGGVCIALGLWLRMEKKKSS